MIETIKSVRIGILIGLLGLTFGIGWAFYLVLGHEQIHKCLEKKQSHQHDSHTQLFVPQDAEAHSEDSEDHHGTTSDEHGHDMEDMDNHGEHDNPIFELAHRRLTRGHIHAMGLGLLTIAICFILAFTSAPEKVKTAVSILTGIGGIIYPIAWIAMGYRTPGLGEAGAEASVTLIAGPGVALVLLGIAVSALFLIKDIFMKRSV